jgi:serine/threonine protein kinase
MSADRSDTANDAGGSPKSGPPPRFRFVAIASGLLTEPQFAALEAEARGGPAAAQEKADHAAWDKALAQAAASKKWITSFQAKQLLLGRRRFTLGQYRILDEIGRGGMGQVFKAEHAMMGRVVAVKVLPRTKSTPETEAAFQREIRMLARLDHDNLVRALDAGHDGNVYYLVTEYVAGLDLRRQVVKYGPLDEPRAAIVISQAARALAYAHEQGLVHRDMKPGNLLVARDGRVKVLDLGLAGSVFEAESMRLGRCVGTIDYMAPEQIRDPDNVGPAADIYSLGCTLYFAVSGRLPFPGGDRKDKARRHLQEHPVPVQSLAAHVSPLFARVIEAMMEKSPTDRIDSAVEVIGMLRPWTSAGLLPMPRQPRTAGGVGPATTSALTSVATGGSSGFLLGDPAVSEGWSPLETIRDGGSEETSAAADEGAHSAAGGDAGPEGRQPRGFVGAARMATGQIRRAAAGIVRLVEGRRMLRAALQSLLLAAPMGAAFGFTIHAVSQINPAVARGILGDASPTTLGWAAFGISAAVLFLAAFGRRRS